MREDTFLLRLTEELDQTIVKTVDPVFLLSLQDWRQLYGMDKRSNAGEERKQYVLIYMLGDIDFMYNRQIEIFAEKNKYNIVDISPEYRGFGKKHSVSLCLSPVEFLKYIDEAAYVITDSFHGTVFSIIYEKSFWVLKRKAESTYYTTNNRIKNLLSSFELEDNLVESIPDNTKEIFNWKEKKRKLSKDIRNSQEWLKNVLKI